MFDVFAFEIFFQIVRNLEDDYHKFAYLTIKKMSQFLHALDERHFAVVLILSRAGSDVLCSYKDGLGTCRQIFKLLS